MTQRELPGPEHLAKLVSGVTQTMFGMSFALASEARPSPWSDEPAWRTVVLDIAGARHLTVAVAADDPAGRVLGGQMFSCTPEAVDSEMVRDSLAELVNIVAGQIKASIGLDAALGLPRHVERAVDEVGARSGWRAAHLTHAGQSATVWVAVTEAATA